MPRTLTPDQARSVAREWGSPPHNHGALTYFAHKGLIENRDALLAEIAAQQQHAPTWQDVKALRLLYDFVLYECPAVTGQVFTHAAPWALLTIERE